MVHNYRIVNNFQNYFSELFLRVTNSFVIDVMTHLVNARQCLEQLRVVRVALEALVTGLHSVKQDSAQFLSL